MLSPRRLLFCPRKSLALGSVLAVTTFCHQVHAFSNPACLQHLKADQSPRTRSPTLRARALVQHPSISVSNLAIGATRGSTTSRAMSAGNNQAHLDALAVIQKQLEIYNKRDVEEFMTLFSEDCQLVDLQSGKELCRGKEAIKTRYTERFKSPVVCQLHARVAVGQVVVDKEHISGLPDGKEANVMAVYQVNDEAKIHRIQFVWQEVTKD